MNGKQSKMLRKMNRDTKRDKRIFQSLTPSQKGQLTTKFRENMKLVHVDFLREYE